MTTEKIQKFWSKPENIARFRQTEAAIMQGVDSRLASSNACLKSGRVTAAEQSAQRRREVGWPEYELKAGHVNNILTTKYHQPPTVD
jgi:hypothetical protein